MIYENIYALRRRQTRDTRAIKLRQRRMNALTYLYIIYLYSRIICHGKKKEKENNKYILLYMFEFI